MDLLVIISECIAIFLSNLFSLLLSSQLFSHLLKKLFSFFEHILFYCIVSSLSLFKDQVGNSEISIQFFFSFSYSIIFETSAIIKFIKYQDPGRNQFHFLNFHQLLSFLLSFVQGFIRRQSIDISLYLFLLKRPQILQNFINFLTKQDRILLFVIVKYAQQPSLMILNHILIQDFLAIASNSKGMLKPWFFAIFSHRVTKDKFVKLDSPGYGIMVSHIIGVQVAALDLFRSKHFRYILKRVQMIISIIKLCKIRDHFNINNYLVDKMFLYILTVILIFKLVK